MSELKPCPFCGNTEIIIRKIPHDMRDIWCNNCYVATAGFDSKSQGINAWNTRANSNKKLADNYAKMLKFIKAVNRCDYESYLDITTATFKLLKEMGMTDE